MPTQKKTPTLYLVKVKIDFSRFFDKETVRRIRSGKRMYIPVYNLILPDFRIKYLENTSFLLRWGNFTYSNWDPLSLLNEIPPGASENDDGFYWGDDGGYGPAYGDLIIDNASSFKSSNFWGEIDAGPEIRYPPNLFSGKMQAITTLKPLEFEKLFIKRCEHYVQNHWEGRYREFFKGDWGTGFGSGFTSAVLNPGVKAEYVKKNQKFFHPRISLQIV